MSLAAFVTGTGLGLSVAAQVGPVSLLCARTALRGRWSAALAVGLGAAGVDLAYAALGIAGAGALLRVTTLRLFLGLAGAAVLCVLGVRTLLAVRRIRVEGTGATPGSPRVAFRTALVATASNPLTVASWGAIFAAASTAALTASPRGAAAMLAGVGLGSVAWFGTLATAMSVVGKRLGEGALRVADALAGLGMVGFGVLLAVRTL
jgi:threonine/homoserine/homoserine lactone efflux protein